MKIVSNNDTQRNQFALRCLSSSIIIIISDLILTSNRPCQKKLPHGKFNSVLDSEKFPKFKRKYCKSVNDDSNGL